MSGAPSPPLVSVLLAVRDGGAYLAPALASVLAQDLRALELIVVEDGSGDDSWAVIQAVAAGDPRVVPLRNQRNLGLAASLNRGLALARGRYLARQDADDLSLPGRLTAQVAFLEAHPEVVLLGAAVRPMDARGRDLGRVERHPASDRVIRWKLTLTNAFHHSTVMLRRQALARAGLAYDQRHRYAQDYDLWSRLLEHGRGANLDQAWVRFRIHDGQASRQAWEAQQAIADQVAVANQARFGLAGCFSPQQVRLLRRAGFRQDDLPAAQRREQLALLRRYCRLGDRALGAGDPDWRRVKRGLWRGLRRAARYWPRDAASLAVLLGLAWCDPAGSLADAAAFLTRGRGQGGGGDAD